MCDDCRCPCAHVVVIILVRQVVVSSQYDNFVFFITVRHVFVFELFERVKYIQSETRNQINDRQYAVKGIIGTIVISNV